MPRNYSTSIVAHVLDVHPKWLDNVLSHHTLPGVLGERQGVSRKLNASAVASLLVARVLIDRLACPTAAALATANQLLKDGQMQLHAALEIRLDQALLSAELDERMFAAVQAQPRRARGRPPLKHRAGDNAPA